jgi:glycosyltransferase involved in cell wall biosynthesis
MRICLVSQEYPPETASGGLGSQTYLKAHGLAELGHQVHVIARSPDADRHERKDGLVHILRIPGFYGRLPMYTPAVQWLTYSAEIAAALWELHARAPLDLIDFPEWGAEGYVHLLNRTEWNRVPVVVQLHGPLVMFAHMMNWPEVDSEFYRVGTAMEATCLRMADAVFSSGSTSIEWCERHYGLAPGSVPILHTGVDTRLFHPGAAPAKAAKRTIVLVGKITVNKGIAVLIDAACQLAAEVPGVRLRLIGAGDPRLVEQLRDRAAGPGCPELLELPGYVAREDLPEQLAQSHLFAMPSFFEGGPGLAYLEAMACGLPVVACNGTGAVDVVRDGMNGLLVPPGDVPALVVALRRLLTDEALRERMGRDAREFAVREMDSGACLRRLESFYWTVARRSVVEEAVT